MSPARDAGRKPGHPWFRGFPSVVLGAVFLGLALSVVAITFLADTVRSEIDALAATNSDTTQWTLAQAEVELLALQVVVQDGLQDAVPDLGEIRRRYDVFYSRVDLIAKSRQFSMIRSHDEAARRLAELQRFLEDHTPVIDSPDPTLADALPALARELDTLRREVRAFSVLGVRLFAEQSDSRREMVAGLLARIGYLTLGLVLALIAVIGILMAMFQRSFLAEQEAAEARNRLEGVIATSLDAVLAVDREGRVIEYNGAAERIFGYSRDEAMARNMADFIMPEDLGPAPPPGMQRFRPPKDRPVIGGGLVRMLGRRKDGTAFPVEVSVSSARSGGAEIFVSFIRDISDRVAAEEELITARDRAVAGEKAKAELLAVMSHEMRTPLNGILGAIDLLEDTRPSERQARFVSAIKTSAGLLLHHVNGVLSMSRADAGQLDLTSDEVDPAALLRELVESQRHAIEAHGNRIVLDSGPAPARIWVDSLRLRQVILNLIGNANKFTRNGDIRVECDSAGEGRLVEFRVIDTGIGIPEPEHERIFEEFRMLDTSYGRAAEGTGLGLAISRRLAHAMGGEIGVESEAGEGSLFWLRLPVGLPETDRAARSAGMAVPGPATKGRKPAGQGLSLLLVEDNEINRLVAREMLEQAGHRVVEATDGREGLRLAEEQRFDAILMDISMPELDGVTASRRIRAGGGVNRGTPILAVTAHALESDKARFLAAGISDIVVKPLTKRVVLATLARVAGGSGGPVERPQETTGDVLLALAEQLGPERARAMAKALLREVEALIAQMTSEGWSLRPARERADEVHKVAGSASVFAAARLLRRLMDLEDGLRAGQIARETSLVEAVRRAWRETREEIEARLDEMSPEAAAGVGGHVDGTQSERPCNEKADTEKADTDKAGTEQSRIARSG